MASEARQPGAVESPVVAPSRLQAVGDAAWRSGAIAAVVALGAGALGIDRRPGIGMGQIMLLVAGCLLAGAGLALRVREEPRALRAGLAEAGRFALVVVQAGLLILIVREFQVHSPLFQDRLVPLAFAGFVIHHLLPARFRLPFFLLLGFAAIEVVFGIANGVWLVVFGLGLLGLCHLPVRFALRIALVVAAGTGLALLRVNLLPVPLSAAIWPILGSMFMFRIIIYLYDLKHARERPGLFQSLSYFFLLPNVAFPLFPVIDFSTFRRTYYDRPAIEIYQRGIRWLMLGVTHLLVYRLIYMRFTLLPSEVVSLPDLMQHAVTNFLLYFRIAGQFHIVIGILHLFGFHLPRVYNYFPLARSFTDLWRRNNIYWKDFMQKVVYYPTFFRARRLGETRGLVIATVTVVVVTWILHSYQWLWILGRPFVGLTDVLFWSVLGTGMVINVLHEMKSPRRKTLGVRRWDARESLSRALRTVGFFFSFCLLWSLWTSPTVGDWLGMLGGVRPTPAGVTIVVCVLAGCVLAYVAVDRVVAAARAWSKQGAQVWLQVRPIAGSFAGLAGLVVLGSPMLASVVTPAARGLLQDVRITALNRQDAALQQRGYYEDIAGANRMNLRLWEQYTRRPDDWPPIGETEASRTRADLLELELRPHVAMFFRGQTFRTNRWGMRDQEYDSIPAPGVHRIALLGASYVMGSGVANGETFEALVEARLNAGADSGSRFEILNFAVGGYTPVQNAMIMEDRVLAFRPDHVFLIGHHRDAELITTSVIRVVRRGGEIPFGFLREKLAEAEVDRDTPETEAYRKLAPYEGEIHEWALRRIATLCREQGITPVWIYLGLPGAEASDSVIAQSADLALEAGFEVMSLAGVYGAVAPDSLMIAPWDRHPNAEGHRRIARRLYDEIIANAGRIGLPGLARAQPAAQPATGGRP